MKLFEVIERRIKQCVHTIVAANEGDVLKILAQSSRSNKNWREQVTFQVREPEEGQLLPPGEIPLYLQSAFAYDSDGTFQRVEPYHEETLMNPDDDDDDEFLPDLEDLCPDPFEIHEAGLDGYFS